MIKHNYFLAALLFLFCNCNLKAQMVGTNAYIKATSVEIGINGAGGFEGVDVTVSPTIAGMHPRNGGSTNFFGFVANPQNNAWATYDGDFFTPGTPENGWGIQVGNVAGVGTYGNNCNNPTTFGAIQNDIPGTITSWSHTQSCYNSNWEGDLVQPASAGNPALNLHVKINYFLQQTDLFYTTTISITNNGAVNIPTLYYYRSLDPDNNQTVNGSYDTYNLIEDQPGSGSCNIACVSASQNGSAGAGNSYLALAGAGANFRVSQGGFANRDGTDIWNATGGLIGALNSNNSTADEAISLAYKMQNFAPNTTQTFKFVTILNASDKAQAINNLLYLTYPNSQNLPPSVCTPGVDTLSACGGSIPIQVSGPNINDFTWAWTPNIALTTTTGSATIASPVGIQTYTVMGTPTNTCVTPTSFVFVVKPITGVTFTTSALSNTPCLGSVLSLTATGGASYAWVGPNGFTSSIQSPTISNLPLAGVGIYTVTVTNAAGCSVTNSVNVTSGSSPTVVIGSNSPICAGSTLSLTATGGATYNWSGPNGFTSNLQNPTLANMASINVGVYQVTVTASGSSCYQVASVTVAVAPSTTIALIPFSTICNNGNINLVAPSGGAVYAWSGPSSFTSSIQNPTITNVGVTQQGVYSLSITTGACISTGTVQVNVTPPMIFTTLPTNTTLCIGKTGTISIANTGGTGSYNYSWLPTLGLSSTSTTSTTVTGISSTNYTVTVTDANCAITTPIVTTVSVTVNPTPVISFSTSNARGCEPFCTDLISSSVPTSANCEWKFSNNTFLNACNTPTFCFANHGSYNATLTVTDINGCVDSVNQSAFIKVDPNPIADFNWTETNPTIITNDVTFHDQSLIGLPMTGWEWHFGDNYISLGTDTSSLQNPTHTFNHIDTYTTTLIVTNSFGCKDTVSKLVVIEDQFVIYIPNSFSPFLQDGKNDLFLLQGSGFLTEGFEMSIFDRWGTLIYKTTDVNKGWDGSVKGTIAKQDVYVYKIKVKDYKNKDHEYVGHVTSL